MRIFPPRTGLMSRPKGTIWWFVHLLAILSEAKLESGVRQVPADCTSSHWLRARLALQVGGGRRRSRDGGPANHTLALLNPAAAGVSVGGCEIGRDALAIWQMVRAAPETRAEQLQGRVGVNLYFRPWTVANGWRILKACSILRRQVREDDVSLYASTGCETLSISEDVAKSESKLQSCLQFNPLDPIGCLSVATHFLLVCQAVTACPLAVASAYLVIAFAAIPRGTLTAGSEINQGLVESQRLVILAEGFVRSWRSHPAPLVGLFLSDWPIWDLLALIEEVADNGPKVKIPASTPRLPTSDLFDPGPSDPREPFCLRKQNRTRLLVDLESQRVEVIVVYGRMERVKILHRYLARNLRINGGVVDRVNFVIFNAKQKDLDFLKLLIQENSGAYFHPKVTGKRLAKIYSICQDPQTIYVKIDDDTVYLADEAIPNMVRERMRDRCGLVSANVVNHAILSAVHQDIGAIRNFFPPEDPEHDVNKFHSGADWRNTSWFRSDEHLALSAISKESQSQCVWALWECGAWMHESFLSRLADETDCAYDFGWHDFHAHGYGTQRGKRFVPLPYSRWSINVIAFKVEDVAQASADGLAEDDEAELSVVVPNRIGKRSCAVGKAIAVHFSYSRQNDGIEEYTNLLARYEALSSEMATLPIVPPCN